MADPLRIIRLTGRLAARGARKRTGASRAHGSPPPRRQLRCAAESDTRACTFRSSYLCVRCAPGARRAVGERDLAPYTYRTPCCRLVLLHMPDGIKWAVRTCRPLLPVRRQKVSPGGGARSLHARRHARMMHTYAGTRTGIRADRGLILCTHEVRVTDSNGEQPGCVVRHTQIIDRSMCRVSK